MNVLASNIAADVAVAPKKETASKPSGSPNRNKGHAVFADVLNSAAQPKSIKAESEPKGEGSSNPAQPARPTGEVIPLFNNLMAMPVSILGIDTKDGTPASASADVMPEQASETNIPQSGNSNFGTTTASHKIIQSVLSESSITSLTDNTGKATNHTASTKQVENLKQAGIGEAAEVPESISQNIVIDQPISVSRQDNPLKDQGATDDRIKQDIVNAVEQSLVAGQSRSGTDPLLKPLAAVALYQNTSLSPASTAANESNQVKEETDTLGISSNGSRASFHTMNATKLATGTDQETANSSLFAESNLTETRAADSIPDKQPLQSFQQILHQANMKDQVDAVEITGQPIPQPPQDANNVVGQIVEHARLIKSPDMSEMVIKLKPEHLGELTLKVAVDNGVVSASFHTNNSEVRGIIEASVQQLRQDMAQQGLKVEYVGVYAGLGQPFSNGQGEANRQQAWKSQATKKSNGDEFSESLEAIENVGITSSDTGVDYRI